MNMTSSRSHAVFQITVTQTQVRRVCGLLSGSRRTDH